MAKFEIEIYQDKNGSQPFLNWADRKLSDFQFAALDAAINRVLAEQGLQLLGTAWLKSLGMNLFEFRIRHTASQIVKDASPNSKSGGERSKILLRVFIAFPSTYKVLILHGYDKASDDSRSRQQKQIAIARARLKQWKTYSGNGI
jgi:hypothetical protein